MPHVEGTTYLAVAPDEVWHRLNDPALLGAAIPGCEALIATGSGAFAARIAFAVGAVKGSYDGTIAYRDVVAPSRCTIAVEGRGAHGSIAGTGALVLTAAGEGTTVSYLGEFDVKGRVAAAGARVLAGVSRKLIVATLANLAAETPASANAFRPLQLFRRDP